MLTLLALLLVVTLPLAPQPSKSPPKPPAAKNESAEPAPTQKKAADEHQPAKSDLPPLEPPQKRSPNQEPAKTNADEELNLNRRLTTFTGLLVAVGFLQLVALLAQAFIFWRTLKENRNLIKAAGKSADAARKGAKAAVASNEITRQALYLTEAADIVIERIAIESDRPPFTFNSTFTIAFKNCGRTRGIQLEIKARAFLPELPGVETSLPVLTTPTIGAADTVDYRFPAPAKWMTAEDFQKISVGSAVLRFEARVSYLDVFKRPHDETFTAALNFGRFEFYRCN